MRQMPRNQGLPFVTNRFSKIILDKHFAALAQLTVIPMGIRPIRQYLLSYM